MANEIIKRKIAMEIPYFQVPNKIFDIDKGLTIYHKIVYLYLTRCANQGSTAFPSYSTIASRCSMSKRKAITTVQELVHKELLIKEIRMSDYQDMNLSNVYIVDNLELWEKGSVQDALG